MKQTKYCAQCAFLYEDDVYYYHYYYHYHYYYYYYYCYYYYCYCYYYYYYYYSFHSNRNCSAWRLRLVAVHCTGASRALNHMDKVEFRYE